MAVHWQCTNCARYKKAMKEYEEDSKEWREFVLMREALIYALLVTQFPEDSDLWAITEGNWKETYLRLSIYEHMMEPMRSTDKAGIYITPGEVHSMIGLSVNAGTQTRDEFISHLSRLMDLDAHRRLNNWQNAQEKEI